MIYRKFQDLQLSGLGLGMMRLPVLDGDDNTVDEAKTAEMIWRRRYRLPGGIISHIRRSFPRGRRH